MTSAPPTPDEFCLAIDIGGTKVEGAVVNTAGEIGQRLRFDVADAGDELFEQLVDMVQRLRSRQPVSKLGVACAGPMSRGGELVSPLNIKQWDDFPLRTSLVAATELEVCVEGDVRALALAEGQYGAAKNLSNYASLVVSTGVGGAFVLDGELIDGNTGNAGHIGHLNVVPNGAACSCGARGCLEAEVSGWAIRERTGAPPAEASEDVRRRSATLVGQAVGTLATVLDFNRCFVAGSVALGFGSAFFERATERAREMAQLSYSSTIEILPSALGHDGMLLGAALVARRSQS